MSPHYPVVALHTDSKYVINCMTEWIYKWKGNGWITLKGSSVENQDLISALDDLIEELNEEGSSVGFHFIPRGLNQEADELARIGARM